ncbi:hypothetical protein BDR26DRAFT_669327 [Obelidium mucronatum]|nr:hypothetical protein BDR26DRAFT_669327 [Obelidium mucronatum]
MQAEATPKKVPSFGLLGVKVGPISTVVTKEASDFEAASPTYSVPSTRQGSRVSFLTSIFEGKVEPPATIRTASASNSGGLVRINPDEAISRDAEGLTQATSPSDISADKYFAGSFWGEPTVREGPHQPTLLETIIDKAEKVAENVEASGTAVVAGVIAAGAAVYNAASHSADGAPSSNLSNSDSTVVEESVSSKEVIVDSPSSSKPRKHFKITKVAEGSNVVSGESYPITDSPSLPTDAVYAVPKKHVRVTRSRTSLSGSTSNISEPRNSYTDLPVVNELRNRN